MEFLGAILLIAIRGGNPQEIGVNTIYRYPEPVSIGSDTIDDVVFGVLVILEISLGLGMQENPAERLQPRVLASFFKCK